LSKQLEKEKSLIKQFNHLSSIIFLRISKETIKRVNNDKILGFASKTISKLLFKTSRRNDIVGYYENGTFALILKHTNLISAKRTAERLRDLVNSTNFFWGDKDIKLDISIGISNISQNRAIEESLECANRSLEKADIDPNIFMVICEQDEALVK
jgi:diguanylate cyclase (GGDEF)-like protein